MTLFLTFILVLLSSIALTFSNARLWVWTAAVAALLLIGNLSNVFSGFATYIIWPLFIICAAVINIRYLRRWLVSRHILTVFRRIMPGMSRTEREALEAGTVWWDAELFSGKPDWQKLLSYPAPGLSDEEQAFLDGPVEKLCLHLDDWQITHHQQDLPDHVWTFLKEQGFFGMIIPKQYGGKGFSALAHSSVVMKIASRSITAAVTTMVPNSLGPAELLLHYGTRQQKDYYLPRLARGEDIPCFALTGPDAGSDAGAMTDNGIVEYGEFDGKQVLGIRLNWNKRYITLGPVATLLGLAFKLYDPQHHLGEAEDIGITLALIPTDTPGISIGDRHMPMNIPFQNGPNSGKDVFIPMSWVIGGQAQLGQGWRMLMDCLAAGRSISLPALSTGTGKLACRATGAYARIRKQFNMPIGRFEGVEEALTRIAGLTYIIDAARILTAGAIDQGEKPSVSSAIIKYHTTEMMRRVINDAMDIQGGSGICLGRQNLIGRIYQALPIAITVEGANILTRSMIIYGQGAVRCHPYIFDEMQAVAENDQTVALEKFDRAFFGHIGFTMCNLLRSLILMLFDARIVRTPGSSDSHRYMQHLTRLSSAFAFCSDVALFGLGGKLKFREKLSARLGDALSYLYLASAVIKRFNDMDQPEDDRRLLRWACDECLYRIESSLLTLAKNYPVRPLGWLMRLIVAPFFPRYNPPTDKLGHAVTAVLLTPSLARERLTRGIYIPSNQNNALAKIEDALYKVIMAEPIEKKVRYAIKRGKLPDGPDDVLMPLAVNLGVIDEHELNVYRNAVEARQQVIRVDAYTKDFSSTSDSHDPEKNIQKTGIPGRW